MKIAVVGTGYVGLSNALLLSSKNEVVALDIKANRVDLLNKGLSPIEDKDIQKSLLKHKDNLTLNPIKSLSNGSFSATLNKEKAFTNAAYIIIATPTNYDENTNIFDTSSVELVIEDILRINKNSLIIVKSTIPVGFTESIKKRYKIKNIIFSPEFLREGYALYDNLYPSRIIIGEESKRAKEFTNILANSAEKKDIKILMMKSSEAEAVKLFSNSYLAMRIAFFNELDSYAEMYNLKSQNIIEGMGCDERIGMYYNNPSFGYGGYCLPKDTKQLKANFKNVPNALIGAIVDSNKIRKEFIVDQIAKKDPKVLGIYRLIMKNGSDNFRESATMDIIKQITSKYTNIEVIIFEPILSKRHLKKFKDFRIIEDLKEFKMNSDLIIANRLAEELIDVKNKTYTRDLFNLN